MINILLYTHIALGSVSLIAAFVVAVKTNSNQFDRAKTWASKMWQGTIATTISGVGLLFVSPSITRTCVTLASFLAFVYFVHLYNTVSYKKSLTA